jgi:nicotinate dehydrogenase subunit A
MAMLRQGDLEITVNGQPHMVEATPETPLLYVLRNELKLNAAKFGCGLSQCGACTVHVDGEPVRSCIYPVSDVAGKQVTTLEGLGTEDKPHPIQQAFLDEQAAQCGYCIPGMMMRAQALLQKNPAAADEDIRAHMEPNLCRCGTHIRIMRAIKRAAKLMQTAGNATAGRAG